jgi:S-DNA-T family DNA segregation ATPase FtsK/SpoIIIE
VTVHDLIGATAADVIAERVKSDEVADGTARFLLDRLTSAQVGAICRAVLSHPELGDRCRLRIPRLVGEAADLPAETLTDERTTYWRNQECDRPLLVLANTDDDQGQSLKDVTAIGSEELLAEPELWVARASVGLSLSPTHQRWWAQALRGLQEAKPMSIDAFGEYILDTQRAVGEEGVPIVQALGWALPAIRAPRDSAFFNAIPEKALGHASRWRKMYGQLLSKRAVYLMKVSPSHQAISSEQLSETFQRIRSEIDDGHHAAFEEFIRSEASWNPAARALSELEWELDKVKSLFDGLRVKPDPLGKATLSFYEDEYPQALSGEEHEQLDRLDRRQTREANEDDQQFYERHRHELGRDRILKAKWDRFVYGQPIETTEFLVGLLRVLERLFEQTGSTADKRRLRIESSRRTKRDWFEVNYDAASYFSRRYRGIRALCGTGVTWDATSLFDFEKFVSDAEARGKYERNRSTKRSALQLKFTITLETTVASQISESSTQLVWTFNPNSVLCEYHEDWIRVAKHPFCLNRVSRELVSAKGRLQSIELRDVSTLMPVFRQDRGSLVAPYDKSCDVDRIFLANLDEASKEARVTTAGRDALVSAWTRFSTAYRAAVSAFLEEGLPSELCVTLANDYEHLLNQVLAHALGDRNRDELLSPILKLGIAEVDGGESAAIVAPWHPMRIVATSIKARYIGGLIKHLMSSETVNFGDPRLFFRDIASELTHVYYPEVCLGTRGSEPVLLAVSEVCGEYSLMESPTRRREDEATTNEDPKEAAQWLLQLVRRYLQLQPHEAANLTTVLYNCDTARLPEEAVSALGQLYEEEDEVRCQVILRHSRPEKLSRLYEALLETSERDVDSMVASEASRDFMARLRIGIMADQAVVPSAIDGPPADIVFLQDVIARLAEVRWTDEVLTPPVVDILHHIPPRWSRRRPGLRHDLKSTTYLACPVQPSVGWSYLRAMRCLALSEDSQGTTHSLPSRQISFQNNDTREIFDEVHRLGQWVVNHDELLTRRQLRNLGVQIIRYQQQGYEGRSLIISSKAPLNLLSVLVQRRLQDLSLGLATDDIARLAERMISTANDISGDIVLRAAKRACFANELIGLVLSRFLLEDEIGVDARTGWYFLDDYAGWLGQKQEHIADILALSPQEQAGNPRLVVLLSEAKYVGMDSLAAARRSSEVQLRETQSRIQEGVFGDPGRLDRDMWLARLADLLLDGVEVAPTDGILLSKWRDAVRDGTANILLRGYSHVFVHRMSDGDRDPSERCEIGSVEGAWQEVYGRDAVRDLVLAYHDGKSPRSVRERLGSTPSSGGNGSGTPPAPRVRWTAPLSGTGSAPPPATPPKARDPLPRAGSAGSATGKMRAKSAEMSTDCDRPTRNSGEVVVPVTPPASDNAAQALGDFAWAPPALAERLSRLGATHASQAADLSWLSDTVVRLRSALLSYSFQAKVVDQRLTPNAALIRLQGSDRLRVPDVDSRRGQLLTTHELRVIRVSAEPGHVVVAIARPQREIVSFVDVLRTRIVDDAAAHVNQSLVVGVRETDGKILYLAPGGRHAPHTLIAGTTGSGKSVLLQNLILDIGMTNSPRSARITLIDPKQGVDYFALENLPHLDGGLIVEQSVAVTVLEDMVKEMDDRYRRFREARASNLADYNSRARPEDRLPVRWIIHDEFAEWMLVEKYKEVVSNVVQRLGVKARAAGIFLIFAAQRPEDRVMPVQLRDNLGNRLILRVESEGTSRISLGEEGAERLLGKGHLAARLPGEDDVLIAQVPILDAASLEELVRGIVCVQS